MAKIIFINFLKNNQLIDNTMTVWKPACGERHIVNIFVRNDIKCIGTDIKTDTDFFKKQYSILLMGYNKSSIFSIRAIY